jgi:hypothetical protein
MIYHANKLLSICYFCYPLSGKCKECRCGPKPICVSSRKHLARPEPADGVAAAVATIFSSVEQGFFDETQMSK